MPTLKLFVCSLVAVALSNLECTKSDITSPALDENLLTNGSFESNNSPSLSGWTPYFNDTAYVDFDRDVPPNGGSYSLKLKNYIMSQGSVLTMIPIKQATNRIHFTFWSKSTPTSNFHSVLAVCRINIKKPGIYLIGAMNMYQDSVWTQHTVEDTISVTTVDTLYVELSAGSVDYTSGYSLFDLCRLTIQ
jgi:hypothetical protein